MASTGINYISIHAQACINLHVTTQISFPRARVTNNACTAVIKKLMLTRRYYFDVTHATICYVGIYLPIFKSFSHYNLYDQTILKPIYHSSDDFPDLNSLDLLGHGFDIKSASYDALDYIRRLPKVWIIIYEHYISEGVNLVCSN